MSVGQLFGDEMAKSVKVVAVQFHVVVTSALKNRFRINWQVISGVVVMENCHLWNDLLIKMDEYLRCRICLITADVFKKVHLSSLPNLQTFEKVIACLKMFLNGPSLALFHLFSYFQTNITIFTTNKFEKMSIQYKVLGFKPTTFRLWEASHNH